jgi:TPP-dependent pyruvate/acetoin dehydrogenase alpha subunit
VDIHDDAALTVNDLAAMLTRMAEIRALEDEIQRAFTQNLVRGSTHLCIGQEACVVGACAALREDGHPDDAMVCTYRGHGAVLAMGAPLDRSYAEILGRSTGLCRGKGGSMHLTDTSVGAYGSFAIVGAHLPIAVGLGFAARHTGSSAVALCFFGDGSTNIGAFHESLNLAAIWKLPVVFFCENNLYGEYSPMRATTPIERLSDRAAAYAMPGVQVDGNDIVAVRAVTGEAVRRARGGEGPTLIEALTYRHRGHSRTDPASYRPAGELEAWKAYDPIDRLNGLLLRRGIGENALEEIHAAARASVASAVAAATADSEPGIELLIEDVYA